ncbi:MAG: hypothetical protein M3352_11875 [Bacteroidota bacterium]|nr:hypothetical protein [Bacteroidota bacterium]
MENRNSNLNVSPRGRSKGGKYFRIFMIVLFLILSVFIYWRYFFTYSSGNRYGLLQKFSHKGNLFKTYEGEMILSSIRSNNNVPLASEKFFFSVTDKNVANQLMNVQGKFLTVHYKEKKGTLSFRGDSPYIVDSIKVEQP